MGWTIDVPITPRKELAGVLNQKLAVVLAAPSAADQLVGWPKGTLDMHPATAAEDDPERFSFDRGSIRPEVRSQIEAAIADANDKAAGLEDKYVSASLTGHVQHPVLPESDETVPPRVEVVGHTAEEYESHRAAVAEREARRAEEAAATPNYPEA